MKFYESRRNLFLVIMLSTLLGIQTFLVAESVFLGLLVLLVVYNLPLLIRLLIKVRSTWPKVSLYETQFLVTRCRCLT